MATKPPPPAAAAAAIPSSSALAPNRRSQPLRQARTTRKPPRGAHGSADTSSSTANPQNLPPKNFYPALTAFTDAISALPSETIRHFTLLREVDAKACNPEAQLRALIAAAEALPGVPDSANTADPAYTALLEAPDLGTPVSEGTIHSFPETRRARCAQIRQQVLDLIPVQDEKIHVVTTANEALQRLLNRLEHAFAYTETEIPAVYRVGSGEHWAYKDPSSVNGNGNGGNGGTGRTGGAGNKRGDHQEKESHVRGGDKRREEDHTSKKKKKPQQEETNGKRPAEDKKEAGPKKRKVAPGEKEKGGSRSGTPAVTQVKKKPVQGKEKEVKRRPPPPPPPPLHAGAQRPPTPRLPTPTTVIAPSPRTSHSKVNTPTTSKPTSAGGAGSIPPSPRIGASGMGSPKKPHSSVQSASTADKKRKSSTANGAGASSTSTPTSTAPPSRPKPTPTASSSSIKNQASSSNTKSVKSHSKRPSIAAAAASPRTRSPGPRQKHSTSHPSSPGGGGAADADQDTGMEMDIDEPIVEDTKPTRRTRDSPHTSAATGMAMDIDTPTHLPAPTTASSKRRRPSSAHPIIHDDENDELSSVTAAGVTADGENEEGEPEGDGDGEADGENDDEEDEEEEEDGEEEEETYCYCEGVSYGEMVACDGEDCKREWFHLECVGLETAPRGNKKWFCEECKAKMAERRR